jgi:hypothetical protein
MTMTEPGSIQVYQFTLDAAGILAVASRVVAGACQAGDGRYASDISREEERTVRREEATALFERVYERLSILLHPFKASLVCSQDRDSLEMRTWYVVIESRGNRWEIMNEQDWQEYKRTHPVNKTDELLEDYADAVSAGELRGNEMHDDDEEEEEDDE